MASLKTLRTRIKSVKSTQKITKAMKMVAAAKLRRAKDQAEAARPYAERMQSVLSTLSAGVSGDQAPKLMAGTGRDETHLLIVATSDRGLCGAFNSSIVRAAKRRIGELRAQGKQVKLFCVGRKGYEQLAGEYGKLIIQRMSDIGKKKLSYHDAETIAAPLLERFDAGEFDVVTVIYNHFKSAISQKVTFQQLIPLAAGNEGIGESGKQKSPDSLTTSSPYEYEPNEEEILRDILPKNITVQIYKALLENAASEQGARMTAMDNATRNAGEMIKKLTVVYNRSRQATITKELIEIISGAEAV